MRRSHVNFLLKTFSSFYTTALFCLAGYCIVNGTVLYSSVSQDSLYIGDRIRFSVTMLVPKGATITPPATDNGFGQLKVKEWTSDKAELKNADSLSFHYILTTYTTEQCTIPALSYLQAKGIVTDTFTTQAIPLRVVFVTSSDTGVIRDIKPPQSVGKPSLLWLWILLGVAALIALILIIKKSWKKAIAPVPIIPPKPPYEEAIEALRLLEQKNYISQGLIRDYVFELSDIVKRYAGRRYDVNAAEFTTEEILDWIRLSPLDASERKTLDWFFATTDPVKFAKLLPDNKTITSFGEEIRGFLEKTKPQPQNAATAKKETDTAHAA